MSTPEHVSMATGVATPALPQRRVALLQQRSVTRLLTLALALITLALALYNLPYYPRTWFDEGSHLHVPKTLVQYGVYADISSEGFRYYGPTIGVGPTMMLPIAAVFRMFGPSLLAGRLVISVYLLAALWLFYLLARQFRPNTSPLFALLATALLLTSRGVGTLEYGREVLGEIPALAWLLLGMVAWLRALDRPAGQHAWGWMITAGLGFGLAMVTKNQTVLIVPPLLVVLAALDWRYYRAGNWRLHAVPFVIAMGCYALWVLAQFTLLGPGDFLTNVRQTRQAAGGAIFVFDRQATLRALHYLVSPNLYGCVLLPALAYGLWRCRARGRQGLREALVCVFVTLYLGWFVVSLGWPRYAFAAAALGALLVAQLAWNVLGWLTHSRRLADRSALGIRLLVACFLALLILVPLAQTATAIARPDRSPQQLAAYLNTHLPTDTLIETWEPELGALTDHRYHYPPIALLDTAVRHTWLNGPPLVYDGLKDRPPYVVVGAFGSWVQIYNPATLQQEYIVEYTAGPYTLYHRK